MNPANACTRCESASLANAPAGLCPLCLLGHGLRAARVGGPDREGNGVTPFGRQHPPHPSGILSTLDEALGPVPRVLLRESSTGEERPARVTSEDVPVAVGDAGRYQLHGEIARGGMGVVLKGRDVDLGRDVAVKILLERHRDSPEMVRRFVEEAQIGGQLQHPGIVPVYEMGRLPDGRLYIAMKLIRGRTLAELLADQTDPVAYRAHHLATFEQVCRAVAYAHACGVVHRDLKPSNVMVGGFGEVFVMDWGLAKVLDYGGVADEERSLQNRADTDPIRTLRTVLPCSENASRNSCSVTWYERLPTNNLVLIRSFFFRSDSDGFWKKAGLLPMRSR